MIDKNYNTQESCSAVCGSDEHDIPHDKRETVTDGFIKKSESTCNINIPNDLSSLIKAFAGKDHKDPRLSEKLYKEINAHIQLLQEKINYIQSNDRLCGLIALIYSLFNASISTLKNKIKVLEYIKNNQIDHGLVSLDGVPFLFCEDMPGWDNGRNSTTKELVMKGIKEEKQAEYDEMDQLNNFSLSN